MIFINTRKVAFGGIATAFSVAVLYMASVLPTLKLALCAITSVIICICAIKYNLSGALMVYAATSAVSVLILPNKMIALAYFVVFGNYPIVKSIVEQKNISLAKERILKVILYLIYATLLIFGINLLFSDIIMPYSYGVMYVVVVVCAIVYDIGISVVLSEISRRFSKFL